MNPLPRQAPCSSLPRKKLSTFLHTQQWKGASNYVAKRYIESVDRDVYFEDVRLQMEAKLWGEEYNRHKPPKQVCGTVLATYPHQGSQGQCQEMRGMRVMMVVPVTGFLLHHLNYSSY